MWVRLKSIQNIDRGGRNIVYRPGDWVDVGKQTAMLWMSRGEAEIPSYRRETMIAGEAGVVIKAAAVEPFEAAFHLTKLELTLTVGDPCISFHKTMCWSPEIPLRPELVGAGFAFLDTWEIAAPLLSYDELAVHIGSEADRAKTAAIVRDLRIPVYDTRLLFIKNCDNTKRLFDRWTDEREAGGDERLAFMRAFYEVKPLMLALPVTWHSPRAYADVV